MPALNEDEEDEVDGKDEGDENDEDKEEAEVLATNISEGNYLLFWTIVYTVFFVSSLRFLVVCCKTFQMKKILEVKLWKAILKICCIYFS